MSGLSEYAKRVAELVDRYIYENVKGVPQTLYDAALHLIRAGGKRLRPLIVVTAAQALGANIDKALPFAAAVEIIHNFTLIHDDIMDRDEFRRGVPTVHKLWGEALAITAGDLLFAKAFEILVKARDHGVPFDRVLRAVEVLSRASAIIAEGQALDIMFEDREDVSIEEYLDMVYRKTGALFEASAVLGGLTATNDERILRALAEYGKSLGIAFQIRDDILGLVGDEKVLGKPVYSDLREGKKTILVVYALSRLGDKEREKLLRVLGNRSASREELEEAANLIKSTGAISYAERMAEDYARRARNALEILPRNEHRVVLEELTSFVVRRAL